MCILLTKSMENIKNCNQYPYDMVISIHSTNNSLCFDFTEQNTEILQIYTDFDYNIFNVSVSLLKTTKEIVCESISKIVKGANTYIFRFLPQCLKDISNGYFHIKLDKILDIKKDGISLVPTDHIMVSNILSPPIFMDISHKRSLEILYNKTCLHRNKVSTYFYPFVEGENSICNWFIDSSKLCNGNNGILCNTNGFIEEIVLSNMGLLSNDIFELLKPLSSTLKILDISHNPISGVLPSNFFTNFDKLLSFNVKGTLLSGDVPCPNTIKSNIVYFNILQSNFSGNFPLCWTQNEYLYSALLSWNNFTFGSSLTKIIKTLGSNIRELSIASTNTVFNMEDIKGNKTAKNLIYIDISQNSLNDNVSNVLSFFKKYSPSLKHLDMTSTGLYGYLPDICKTNIILSHLGLGWNYIKGNINFLCSNVTHLPDVTVLNGNNLNGNTKILLQFFSFHKIIFVNWNKRLPCLYDQLLYANQGPMIGCDAYNNSNVNTNCINYFYEEQDNTVSGNLKLLYIFIGFLTAIVSLFFYNFVTFVKQECSITSIPERRERKPSDEVEEIYISTESMEDNINDTDILISDEHQAVLSV
jgi:hypothetical protein